MVFTNRAHAGGSFLVLIVCTTSVIAVNQVLDHPRTDALDFIVLRNLTRIESSQIADFDSHAIGLSDGVQIPWDEVLELPQSHPRLGEMTALHKQIGEPFFRLRQRLRAGDWIRAGEIAQRLVEQFGNDPSEYGLSVNAALFKWHLARGRREAAVLPWLKISRHSEREHAALPEYALLNIDAGQDDCDLSPELWPIFFDADAASAVLAELGNEAEASDQQVPPARVIYTAALMTALADNGNTLEKYLAETDWSDDRLQPWKPVFQLASGGSSSPNLDLSFNPTQPPAFATAIRQISNYWLIKRKQSVDATPTIETTLAYLDLAADRSPGSGDLAAAAIWEASVILEGLNRLKESNHLREELSRTYALTYHGQKLSGK